MSGVCRNFQKYRHLWNILRRALGTLCEGYNELVWRENKMDGGHNIICLLATHSIDKMNPRFNIFLKDLEFHFLPSIKLSFTCVWKTMTLSLVRLLQHGELSMPASRGAAARDSTKQLQWVPRYTKPKLTSQQLQPLVSFCLWDPLNEPTLSSTLL